LNPPEHGASQSSLRDELICSAISVD